jgi:hypothetical protein
MRAGNARNSRNAVFHRLCGCGGSISRSIGYELVELPTKNGGYGLPASNRYASMCVPYRR